MIYKLKNVMDIGSYFGGNTMTFGGNTTNFGGLRRLYILCFQLRFPLDKNFIKQPRQKYQPESN